MILKKGDIVKHFKGKDLIEKNIYEILAVKPEYTGTNVPPIAPVVVYTSLFQEGKTFFREYSDLVTELSPEKKEEYGQTFRVEVLTKAELDYIKTPDFIKKKKAYLESKYAKEETNKNTQEKGKSR